MYKAIIIANSVLQARIFAREMLAPKDEYFVATNDNEGDVMGIDPSVPFYVIGRLMPHNAIINRLLWQGHEQRPVPTHWQ